MGRYLVDPSYMDPSDMERELLLWEQFVGLARSDDGGIDLGHAALMIAATEYPQLDIDRELASLDSLSAAAAYRIGGERDPLYCMNALSEYLFDEVGFNGNSEDYYDPRNSYLNEVLNRRLGIPIMLSLVCIEVGKRLDVPLVGVGMPGHFLVRHRDEEAVFVDPFHRGIMLSEEECAQRLREITQDGFAWDRRYLTPVTNRDYVARILRNLKVIYLQRNDFQRALVMIDRLVALYPEEPLERRDRGLARYRTANYLGARDDLQFHLDNGPAGAETEELQRLIGRIDELLQGH